MQLAVVRSIIACLQLNILCIISFRTLYCRQLVKNKLANILNYEATESSEVVRCRACFNIYVMCCYVGYARPLISCGATCALTFMVLV